MTGLTIVFDGDCVFCAHFARVARLRDLFGAVTLVDARDANNPLIADLARRYRLNDGFVVIHDGAEHYGPEALNYLALASRADGFLARLMRLFFRAPGFSRFGYPLMVRLRKLMLRVVGRKEMAY